MRIGQKVRIKYNKQICKGIVIEHIKNNKDFGRGYYMIEFNSGFKTPEKVKIVYKMIFHKNMIYNLKENIYQGQK